MSVDKFGRHEKRSRAVKGPKGDGFSFTPDGDYDIRKKRLKFVNDPLDATDAVNKRYVDSNTPIKHNELKTYSFHQFNIQDVAYPIGEQDGDCVNVKFLKDKCLTVEKSKDEPNYFDAKELILSNLKDPKKPSDAVTKAYMQSKIPQTNNKVAYWSFSNKRLVSVADPKDSNDVVTLQYMKSHTLENTENGWDFGNRRLINCADPVEEADAINLRYLNSWKPKNSVSLQYLEDNTLVRKGASGRFDAKSSLISNLGDPKHVHDAVNKKYLKYALLNFGESLRQLLRQDNINRASDIFSLQLSALISEWFDDK